MKMIRMAAMLLVLVMLAGVCACTPAKTGEEAKTTEAPATEPTGKTTGEPAEKTTEDTTTETNEKPYVFPENGHLRLLTDGRAPGAIDGRNPSLAGEKLDKILVFFDFTFRKAGLDLADATQIAYSVKREDGSLLEGVATLDTETCKDIKNEYGYVGLCFDIGTTLDRYEKATLNATFKDKEGTEYALIDKKIYMGVSFLGLSEADFRKVLPEDLTYEVGKNLIKIKGTRYDTEFTLTVNLGKWAGKSTAKQIITSADLFWGCYPKMYARFASAGHSPTEVTLAFENEGYGIASAGGNFVHIHDDWLHGNREDFDCLTHEFAHVIQNGWDGKYCEYSGYIERFADACRYLYAKENGKYNDPHWTLNTVEGESTRETSVRFVVWFDYFYSTADNDLLYKWFDTCRNGKYTADRWDEAWAHIFEGTELDGKSIDEIWNMYADSEFAQLSAKGYPARNKPSELLKKYTDLRERVGNT